jgi:SAM-dependent methyltransferase
VDWSSRATQELRFLQLLKLCDFSTPFSLDDLGCGYGALLQYLDDHHATAQVDYLGIDLSAAMLVQARKLWRDRPGVRFRAGRRSPRVADYCVASGAFNVKLQARRADWEALVEETLRDMHARCTRGFAVNFLAPVPPHLPQARQLYRCEPQRWIEFCERALHTQVRLIGGYGLPEYTLVAHRR